MAPTLTGDKIKYLTLDNGDKIILNRANYFLVCEGNVHSRKVTEGKWTINHRVDRSYKGKDDDVGLDIAIIDDQELLENVMNVLDVVWIGVTK